MFLYILHLGIIDSRTATIINDTQKSFLKQMFANEPYPGKDTCQKLSEQLGLKNTTVYNWFKWERAKTMKGKKRKLSKSKLLHVCVYRLQY